MHTAVLCLGAAAHSPFAFLQGEKRPGVAWLPMIARACRGSLCLRGGKDVPHPVERFLARVGGRSDLAYSISPFAEGFGSANIDSAPWCTLAAVARKANGRRHPPSEREERGTDISGAFFTVPFACCAGLRFGWNECTHFPLFAFDLFVFIDESLGEGLYSLACLGIVM